MEDPETETNLHFYCNHFRAWNVRIGCFGAVKREKITQSLTKILLDLINPFVPNAPFLYPLKTSENRKAF